MLKISLHQHEQRDSEAVTSSPKQSMCKKHNNLELVDSDSKAT